MEKAKNNNGQKTRTQSEVFQLTVFQVTRYFCRTGVPYLVSICDKMTQGTKVASGAMGALVKST